MRGPVVMVAAVAALSVAAVTGMSGVASADGVVSVPTISAVPTVSVSVPPLPTAPPTSVPSLPVPTPTVVVPPGGGGGDGGGGDGGGSGGSAGSGGGGSTDGSTDGAAGATSGTTGGSATDGSAGAADDLSAKAKAKARRAAKDAAKDPVRPMIAGRPEAADVLDHESSPALYRASKSFLAADEQIARLAKLRDAMADAKDGAAEAAVEYKALQTDAANVRAEAQALHARYDQLRRRLVNDARRSYQIGHPATDERSTRDLVAAAGRADDGATRAEMRLGAMLIQQAAARTVFEGYAANYRKAQATLTILDRRLRALAEQRAAALAAAQRAASGDLEQHRQTIVESGRLGAQIRAASAQLAASGRTVQGTGEFVAPSSGVITSPYGQRFHPILHYVKLHTGTDFAVGDGYVHAADTGRVLFTVLSQAYGNFTVIDHGTLDGRHITTAYAHQARFLVKPGDVVKKGQAIGVVGATGFATGPHVHFEVRDDGAVVDPMTWLAR